MEISNNIFNVERHRWESCFNSTAHESDTFLIKLFFEGGGSYQNETNSSHICKKDDEKRELITSPNYLFIYAYYKWLQELPV